MEMPSRQRRNGNERKVIGKVRILLRLLPHIPERRMQRLQWKKESHTNR